MLNRKKKKKKKKVFVLCAMLLRTIRRHVPKSGLKTNSWRHFAKRKVAGNI
ncbi:hypothetical protein CJ030_MR1G008997 [Morella rubra]|uniref:Uncharacterized protein n=1 Tax=Morella rubra TaxID=262757 RepID=A0A6A1WRA6_9ROSI|nr:hypothetical protein CJ030_MR1G008997 [Morella rubra]